VSAGPGFSADIRVLFREKDRLSMDFAFDLWSYDEVREQAESILERLVDGTMPCDAPWDEARLQLFKSWIDNGCEP
jgi:hypothetical protein